jgi:hypothetical protein
VPLDYFGGRVLLHPRIYLIFWGSNWTHEEDAERTRAHVVNTLGGLTEQYGFNLTYQHILNQYSDQNCEAPPCNISNDATLAGNYVKEGFPAAQGQTRENIKREVELAIEENHWPHSPDNEFILLDPPGATYQESFLGESGPGEHGTGCGFHGLDNGDVFAFVPNILFEARNSKGEPEFEGFHARCKGYAEDEKGEPIFNRIVPMIASHEYAEAATDPEGGVEKAAWLNSEGFEIADICDTKAEKQNEFLGIWVSALWGNHEAKEKTGEGCVIHDPPEPLPPPPTATTEGATQITGAEATLAGSVNPNGPPDTHYYFEYGTTVSYGKDSPTPPGSDAGFGESAVPARTTVVGLAQGTTYHYRLVASSWAGTTDGEDRTFTALVAGEAKFELGAGTYFDESEHGYGTEANAPWVKAHVGLLLGYPPHANKYLGWYKVPTFAYLDQKMEQKQHSFTNEQYVSAVEAQAAVGYTGTFVDDANWKPENEGPSQTPESIATLLEELHTKVPGLQIEINSQYHEIWPLIQAKNPYVLRALAVVNGVDKAFGVNEPAGITTKSDYEEFLRYVEYLQSHKLFTVLGGEGEKVAEQEYNLATYFLVNDGTDYVSGKNQHPKGTTEPEQFWPGYGLHLGAAAGPKELTSSGYYTRAFENGVVYVNPPQAETRTIKLSKAMETAEGVEESSITLKAGQGAVLDNGPARFGKTSVGASSDHGMFANYKIVHKATLSVSGAVTKLSVYAIPGTKSPEPQALKAVIYSDSGGSPSALLATGTEVTYNGKANGSGWFDLPFGSVVALSPGTYWIGFITGTTTQGMGYRYASVANSRAYNTNTFSSGPTNPFGSSTKDSEQASIYATYTPGASASAPVNTVPPTITGTIQQGQTLTEAHGSWIGEPTSYAYQWQQCQSFGNGCLPISGATSQTYVPVAADVGHTLEVQETATNAAGASSPATSAATAVVQQATATFGKTSVGASSDTFVADRKRVNRYAIATAGSVSKLSVYLAPTGTSGQQVIEGLVYADSSGAPGALLGVSEQLTFKSANYEGWYQLVFSSPLKLAAGNYWIGVITGATSKVASFRYDSVSGSRDYNTNTYTSGPSNPFGSVTTDSEQASLYATYTPE